MLEKQAKEEKPATGQTNGKEGIISKVITNILSLSMTTFQTSFIPDNKSDWLTFTKSCFEGWRVRESIKRRIELLTREPKFNYTSDKTTPITNIYLKHQSAVREMEAKARESEAKARTTKTRVAMGVAVAAMIAAAAAAIVDHRKGTGGSHSSRKTAKSRKGGMHKTMHKKTSNKRIRRNITKTNFKKRWG
jgi:hypothetical protein